MQNYTYTKEERETLIRTDDCQTHYDVESFQPKICNKIRKLKDVEIVTEETTEKGTIVHGIYKIPLKCVSFRNPKILSEEMREMLSNRMSSLKKEL